MSTIENVSRRSFLRGGVIAAGALVLGVRFYPGLAFGDTLPHDTNADHATLHPSVYLGINPDGTVWIVAYPLGDGHDKSYVSAIGHRRRIGR